MADVDLYGEQVGALRHTDCDQENNTLLHWDRDIKRAASARARGWANQDFVSDELAQAARIRVLLAVRRLGGAAGVGYLRKVISHATLTPVAHDPVLDVAEELDADNLTATSDAEQVDEFAAAGVRRWLRTLPTQLQRLYRLLYVEDMSQREAAREMGVSQPRIAQLHRALLQRGESCLYKFAA
jgi:RNA polymerase sigma factor (sigma-70 family)